MGVEEIIRKIRENHQFLSNPSTMSLLSKDYFKVWVFLKAADFDDLGRYCHDSDLLLEICRVNLADNIRELDTESNIGIGLIMHKKILTGEAYKVAKCLNFYYNYCDLDNNEGSSYELLDIVKPLVEECISTKELATTLILTCRTNPKLLEYLTRFPYLKEIKL